MLKVSVPIYANRVLVNNSPRIAGSRSYSRIEQIPWELNQDASGEQTVYAWYTAANGSFSPIFSATILLDHDGPELEEAKVEYPLGLPRLTVKAGDPSGVSAIRYSFDQNLELDSWQPYQTQFSLEQVPGPLYIQFQDGLGNASRVYVVLSIQQRRSVAVNRGN